MERRGGEGGEVEGWGVVEGPKLPDPRSHRMINNLNVEGNGNGKGKGREGK